MSWKCKTICYMQKTKLFNIRMYYTIVFKLWNKLYKHTIQYNICNWECFFNYNLNVTQLLAVVFIIIKSTLLQIIRQFNHQCLEGLIKGRFLQFLGWGQQLLVWVSMRQQVNMSAQLPNPPHIPETQYKYI